MGIRLVSILGMGPNPKAPHYQPTRYQLGNRVCEQPTPLVQAALLELEPEISSVILLGTSAVSERWRASDRLAATLLDHDFAFEEIPDGSTSEERWKIFEKLVTWLSPEPLEGLESEEPDEIIFDVTHGFRLQPMLGLAALSYVRSNALRARESTTPIRVTYGAFDARDKELNITPIWDLAEFMQAGEWNSAFDALLRYGRADELFDVTQRLSRSRLYELETAKALERLGKRARAYADDLVLLRTSNLLRKSATEFYEAIYSPDLDPIFKRLKSLLDQPFNLLVERLKMLESDSLVSREGLKTQAALARELFETGQFASTAGTLREALVDFAGLLLGEADLLDAKDGDTRQKARVEVEGRLNTGQTPNTMEELRRFWESFRNVRNDILHSGRRRDPRLAADLREQLKQALNRFDELLRVSK